MDDRIKTLISNLERRKIKAKYFATKEEAQKEVLKEIDPSATIGIGGSMTIKEMHLYEELNNRGNNVIWHWMVDPEKRYEVGKLASNAEVYLTSTNAITEEGDLINIDGVGNRVSAMFYGPKKVFVICGTNKICSDLITAMDRIKKEACPQNAKRLGLNVPCGIKGRCNDCVSNERMCNVTVIINHKPMSVDLNVFIVGETLGY